MTVPDFVTVTVPYTTFSCVPGGTPVFVGPGLPAGSASVGDAVGVGFGFGVDVGVGFAVGVGFGFGLVVGLTDDFDADAEELGAADADVDNGPVERLGMTNAGVLEVDDGVPGSEDAGADDCAGGADCAEPVLVVCTRSTTAATIRPPSSTNASVTTRARSRAALCRGTGIRLP